MSVTATRDGESFTISEPEGSIEIARAMAEMSRRWGHQGEVSSLIKDFEKIVELTRADPRAKPEEILLLEQKAQKIQLLEDLALSFRATEDEDDELQPRFHGSLAEGFDTLRSYARVVGAKLEIS